MNILDHYVTSAPSPQNAVDIFRGEWASALPAPLEQVAAGVTPLFNDPRITWAAEQFGGMHGAHLLELGPLEGGHTWMLQNAGAASITAIEANTRAYLKCLIAKELLGIERARFLCGDFIEYLRGREKRFDACIASGVLYHMQNPIELLALLPDVTDRLFIWTHYYEASVTGPGTRHGPRFEGEARGEYRDFACAYHRRAYGESLGFQGFCGGSAAHSHWLEREDILACLRHFGFRTIRTAFEQPDHPNGPAFALVALK